MYQLLVVDDEQYAREGIMKTIDWETLGIGRVYGAECAEDAKTIVQNHMPELIICDIEMAEESGIDFLRWLHYGAFSSRLIFLTAHASFSYAQDAVRLGAFEYFLKPVEHGVLRDSAKRALEDYERQMALHDRLSEYEAILKDWELSGDRPHGMPGPEGEPGESSAGGDNRPLAEEETEHKPISDDEPGLIGAVKQYVHENLGDLTRESIAEAVAVNASYLSRLCHKATGEKLSAYILRKRIEYAKELLRETDDKITYIASAVGYLNDSYFIKIFRNVTEMTPYEYRKMCRSGKQGR